MAGWDYNRSFCFPLLGRSAGTLVSCRLGLPNDLAHAPSTAHGQQLAIGNTIRVRLSQSTEPKRRWTKATVVRMTLDTLWYQARGSVLPMPMDNAVIQRRSFQNHERLGLGIGGVVGGVIGAVVGASMGRGDEFKTVYSNCTLMGDCRTAEYKQINSSTDDILRGSVVGALLGAGVGGLIGKAVKRWQTVELEQVMIGDGNLAVSLSIRR